MSKKKSSGNKTSQSKKSLPLQIFIGFVIISFAGYMIYSNFVVSSVNAHEENNKLKQTVYDFQKEGELTFRNSTGEFLSKIDVEIADDEESRSTGLMYRAKMGEDQGMFFIFPYESYQSFWMRNTVLPLDIIFVNSRLEIVNIRKNAKPFDESSYSSEGVAQYVVEVNGGYTDRHNINSGDKIIWRKN